MLVYVLNKFGKPLMPCKPQRARKLLKEGKAKVIQRTPFTIQLNYGSSGYRQVAILGIDPGYEKVGLVVNTLTKQLYEEELTIRTDVSKKIATRAMFRRNRRSRKTRYRKVRFLNRVSTKRKGRIAPSHQHRLDAHIRAIKRIMKLVPVHKVYVEVAKFDIHKIQNPEIQGADYQQGSQLGFWNVREYVLHRDGHQCRHCKAGSVPLTVHHIESRQTGGDRPANLLTLCVQCHEDYHAGKIKLKAKPKRGYKAASGMNIIRRRLVDELKKTGLPIRTTHGHVTKARRIRLDLPKSHVNDAFVIGGGKHQTRCQSYRAKNVRKQNRKIHKGARGHISNQAPRLVFGFKLFDKVKYNNRECFIFARRSSGYFDLRLIDGTKVHSSAKANKCKLLENGSTRLITQLLTGGRGVSSPA